MPRQKKSPDELFFLVLEVDYQRVINDKSSGSFNSWILNKKDLLEKVRVLNNADVNYRIFRLGYEVEVTDNQQINIVNGMRDWLKVYKKK